MDDFLRKKTEVCKLYTAVEAGLEIRRQASGATFFVNLCLDMFPEQENGKYLPGGFNQYMKITKAQANEIFEKRRSWTKEPDPLEVKGYRVAIRIVHEERGPGLKPWHAVYIGAHFNYGKNENVEQAK